MAKFRHLCVRISESSCWGRRWSRNIVPANHPGIRCLPSHPCFRARRSAASNQIDQRPSVSRLPVLPGNQLPPGAAMSTCSRVHIHVSFAPTAVIHSNGKRFSATRNPTRTRRSQGLTFQQAHNLRARSPSHQHKRTLSFERDIGCAGHVEEITGTCQRRQRDREFIDLWIP